MKNSILIAGKSHGKIIGMRFSAEDIDDLYDMIEHSRSYEKTYKRKKN